MQRNLLQQIAWLQELEKSISLWWETYALIQCFKTYLLFQIKNFFNKVDWVSNTTAFAHIYANPVTLKIISYYYAALAKLW